MIKVRSKGEFPGTYHTAWPGTFDPWTWDAMECGWYFEVPEEIKPHVLIREMEAAGLDEYFLVWRIKDKYFVVR